MGREQDKVVAHFLHRCKGETQQSKMTCPAPPSRQLPGPGREQGLLAASVQVTKQRPALNYFQGAREVSCTSVWTGMSRGSYEWKGWKSPSPTEVHRSHIREIFGGHQLASHQKRWMDTDVGADPLTALAHGQLHQVLQGEFGLLFFVSVYEKYLSSRSHFNLCWARLQGSE